MTEKTNEDLTTAFGDPRNYQIAVITESHYHTSGQLLVEKGATGVIVGDDRGRLTINFTNDDSGKYVELDGGGRKIQAVPSHRLKRIYPEDSQTIAEPPEPRFPQEDNSFNYQLLGRLISDCRYYLDMGAGSPKNLWAGSEVEQINMMRSLWDSFPDDKKPEWTSLEEIDEFEAQMVEPEDDTFTPSLQPRG